MTARLLMRQRSFLTLFMTTFVLHAVLPLPEGGVCLIEKPDFSGPGVFDPGRLENQPVASAEGVEVSDADFSEAMRVIVLQPGGEFYNGAINFICRQAVKKGDNLMVQLAFRSIVNRDESGTSRATVFVQGPAPDYKKYLVREISAGSEWKVYQLPFALTDSLPAGQLSLHIGIGGGTNLQTWEIGGIRFLNYQDRVRVEDLPVTRATYEGRDADAVWRVEADARIEKYRKGDFRIQVVDTNGDSVPDARISVEFQRHAFHFGSIFVPSLLLGESKDSEQYREKLLELFNQSGTENALKWPPWDGDWGNNQSQTLEALHWLKDRHFYLRGHVLVWPARENLSKRAQALIPKENPAATDPAVKQLVLDHIADITEKTKDLLGEWDVVNEPYSNHDLMDAFGDEVMVDWFKAARSHLPTQGLFLNDYSILSGGGRDIAHQQDFEATLRFLLDHGAPVTGMGMQSHFGENPTSISRVYEILNHFHDAFPALDIRITELDIDTADEELQADYTHDFLTIVFSHPATLGVQCWGFWAKSHWRPRAAMYTADWREKPNGAVWKKLTHEIWWNDFSGKTDAAGSFSARGFYGDYVVKVHAQGLEKKSEFKLRKDQPGSLRIVLE